MPFWGGPDFSAAAVADHQDPRAEHHTLPRTWLQNSNHTIHQPGRDPGVRRLGRVAIVDEDQILLIGEEVADVVKGWVSSELGLVADFAVHSVEHRLSPRVLRNLLAFEGSQLRLRKDDRLPEEQRMEAISAGQGLNNPDVGSITAGNLSRECARPPWKEQRSMSRLLRSAGTERTARSDMSPSPSRAWRPR